MARSGNTKFLLGFSGSYGLSKLTDKFAASAGGAFPSGNTDVTTSAIVYRDLSRSLFSVGAGLTFGFVGKRWGFDVRTRYVFTEDGFANRYVRTTSTLTRTEGSFAYGSLAVDAGIRFYPKPWIYFRPHVGRVLQASYIFDFNTDPKAETRSEGSGLLSYGGGMMFVVGKGKFRFEFGPNYTRYGSSFGGTTEEISGIFAPTFYL